MLYPPNAPPFVPDPHHKAAFVPIGQIPEVDYADLAICRAPFDEVLARHGAQSSREYRKYAGGWYRDIGIAFPNGRFGFLSMFEERPEEFNLAIQIFRGMHIFRTDYFLARELIGLADESIIVCDGPYLWK